MKIIIAIDPGHGGADPGGLGKNNHHEKFYTLDIAYRLKQLLETNQRYTVVLCRVGDENISLEKRVQRAEKAKADIFISIHINAFLKKIKEEQKHSIIKKKDKVLAKYIHQALVTSLAFPDLGLKKIIIMF